MTVKHAEDVPARKVDAAEGTSVQVLIGDGPHFAMRRFVMEPGGSMPQHTNTVEHEQYVLHGRAVVSIGEEDFVVEEGSVLLIPAGVPHAYRTLGDRPFVFLCMVPNAPDHMELAPGTKAR